MGKKKEKKEDPPPAGAPLWMVTYSDMVTLLLCFFVMQLSMANFLDPGKVDAALESLRAAFSTGGVFRTPEVTAESAKNSDMPESQDENKDVMVAELRDVLSQQIAQDMIRMTQTKTEVRMRLDESIMFRTGSSELHPMAYKVISDIAQALEGEKVTVVVEGHADADGSDETRNWQLSSARAVAVVAELRDRYGRDGLPVIDGKHLKAVGMGEFRPAEIKDGSSKWNRRVEIVIRGRGTAAQGAAFKVESIIGVGNGG